jgi:hypothetical protein
MPSNIGKTVVFYLDCRRVGCQQHRKQVVFYLDCRRVGCPAT